MTHGANIYKLSRDLKVAKSELIDFSSNILPFDIANKIEQYLKDDIYKISLYPDEEYLELRNAISKYCMCHIKDILLGNGVTELIINTISKLKPKKALLLSPVYSEYENELKKIDCCIEKFYLSECDNFELDFNSLELLLKKERFDLIVLCNPNNPTGTLISIENIEKIISLSHSFLIIDETYIEFTNLENSAVRLTKSYDNLIVLRGTSKFFSIPGIRLGYAITKNDELKLQNSLWNINVFASLIGEKIFLDKSFVENRYNNFLKNKIYMRNELNKIKDIKVYPTNSNFFLCKIQSFKTSTYLRNELIKKGIIIRDLTSFEGMDNSFFRVCVLEKKSVDKLVLALKDIL